ncbi:MAG: hypothetical protein A3E36_00650 [Candidatus Andersenbacteria bacterium RIFCSPHIGHO2_12_FULL_45_11b]|uniref:Nudix hydrolase domain-containing protein n=1 Tax=Candidatus Andersenbacteria bacterium RIFCSPHIGHO2_12_FULL_45_11b TaxID=1797282 RepID=A0A1G1X6F9_9BACT|nr:MAG: hypothetical protein A3E36_00650 [Candidatus Andersenbacteria bacterium RIFCSPHIGHO2_12_FULL_45_11b]
MITVHYNNKSLAPNQLWTPSVHGVVLNSKGHILLHKREDSSLWALPGGKMELGESVVSCLKRELLEETGFQVSPEKLLGVFSSPEYLLSVKNHIFQPLLIVFLCDIHDEKPTINNESVAFQRANEESIENMDTFPLVKEIAHWTWGQANSAFFDSVSFKG